MKAAICGGLRQAFVDYAKGSEEAWQRWAGEELVLMARPIETADDLLLDAADLVLMQDGPGAFTLAKAAETAGVSAATFIKRFGSKDRLLLRLSQRWAASLDPLLVKAAATYASPLARLRAVALHNYEDLDHPKTAANQLAVLAIDLQNDEMRGWLHVG